jgi:hypothetical protein
MDTDVKNGASLVIGSIWGFWLGALSATYSLDHGGEGMKEGMGGLMIFLFVSIVVMIAVSKLLQQPRYSTKTVLIAFLIFPFLISFLFPSLLGGNDYYLSKAIKTQDESFCYKIALNSQKTTCFEALAKSKSDFHLCSNITNFDNRKQQCYFDIAIQKDDVSICRLMTEEQDLPHYSRNYKTNCYTHFAQKDPSLCAFTADKLLCAAYVKSEQYGEKMESAIRKCGNKPAEGLCYYAEARDNNNRTLCTYITEPYQQYTKEYCFENVK